MGAKNFRGMKQEDDQVEECDEWNLKDIWDITIEDVERLRHILTPPDDTYDAPATDTILDELLEEFGDELLDITVVDKEACCTPNKDMRELERLLAKTISHILRRYKYIQLWPPSGLKGLLHTLNATVIPMKGKHVNPDELDVILKMMKFLVIVDVA
ncbi:hypothetical protein Tco_0296349 [Tanacetum coccineum]